MKGTESSGTSSFRGVQAAIGEVIALKETIWALTTAMVSDPEPGISGTVVPRLLTAAASRIFTTNVWTDVRNIFETTLAGAPSFTISGVEDMHSAELTNVIDKFYQGNNLSGRDRIKFFNLVWDSMYSEFAGRHGLYERNYAGNKDQQRLDTLRWSQLRGDTDRYKALVENCLADYDEHGWKANYLK